MLRLGAIAPMRQPQGHGARSRQRQGTECEKTYAPAEPVSKNASGHAADEAAESCAANVEADDEGDLVRWPLFANVSHKYGDYAGDSDALEKSPENELGKRCGCGGEQRRQRDAKQRSHDDAFARKPLRECAEDGRRDSDPQRGR